jgi:Ca2+-binding EF-hand superfamily protein
MGFKKFSVASIDKEEALSAEEEEKYTKYFTHFDKDKSGDISVSELQAVLKHCGFEFDKIPGALAWMVSLVDLDGTKTLSLGEFKFFVGNLLKYKRSFKKADKDGSGHLSTAEVQALFTSMGFTFTAKQTALLASLVDKDSSGSLGLEEFMLLSVFVRFAKIQFILADSDGSGHLTRGEVKRYLPALGLNVDDAALEKLLARLDSDGNTQALSAEEFIMLAAMVKLE